MKRTCIGEITIYSVIKVLVLTKPTVTPGHPTHDMCLVHSFHFTTLVFQNVL
ncbi:UNVERIFIED_CONTAM: hypothetical protein FKN15_014670 [Acipenser sinensis]